MYYFSETSIKSSFNALKGKVENKFLGILGILKSINSDFAEPNVTYKPKSVIRDSFLLFLMTAIRKLQSYLSDCQQFTIFTTQKKSYSYDA